MRMGATLARCNNQINLRSITFDVSVSSILMLLASSCESKCLRYLCRQSQCELTYLFIWRRSLLCLTINLCACCAQAAGEFNGIFAPTKKHSMRWQRVGPSRKYVLYLSRMLFFFFEYFAREGHVHICLLTA